MLKYILFLCKNYSVENFEPHKALLSCLLLLASITLSAQEYSFGLKGGLNASINQKAAEIVGSAGSFTTESRLGYQAGAFFQINYGKLYIRPEVFYSLSEGEFPFPHKPSLYSIEKISIPLLVGYEVYGPFSVFAGPAYQHFLSTELENIPFDIENQQNNIAAQFGVMYEYNRIQIDLRYEFTLSSEENQRIDIPGLMNQAYFDDGRLNQLMLSINFKLWDSANPWMMRRKRSCYF